MASRSKHLKRKVARRPARTGRRTFATATTPKLDEVARAADVSTATVSRFFKSPDRLAAHTAQRVREVVKRLGYVPNLVAGGLASSRTRLVAAVIPSISQSIFSSTIQAITDTLADAGYSVVLALTGVNDEHAERQVLSAIGRRPDGIILTGPTLPQEVRQRLRGTDISTIETWDLPTDPIDLVVGFSHEAVGAEVARHVLATGRRRTFVASATGMRALARRYSFAKAMMQRGAPEPAVATFSGPSTYRHGRSAVAAHLDSGGQPEVIVCSSDWSAHGALDELRTRGIRVPHDVAVIGFGDLDFAAELQPSLTTVKIDGTVIGSKAAEFLLLRAESRPIEAPVVDIGFSLVVRESG